DGTIEGGSGLGDYALEWADRVPKLTATEADPERLVRLKERMDDHPGVHVRELLLPTEERAGHTAAVSYNVLEHIEDHVGALKSMAGLGRAGGAGGLVVPGVMFAMWPGGVGARRVRRDAERWVRGAGVGAGA